MYCNELPTERFFDAYYEIRPPEPGWRERLELLNLRELLSTVAHLGDHPSLVEEAVMQIHTIISAYR